MLALGIVLSHPGLAGTGRFHGKAGQAPHCWAVPRAPAQAVAILVSVNTLTSQFPECLCHLFMPAFYLYS